MTDNKTFIVQVTYWKNNHRGFTVGSPLKTLPHQIMQTVKQHLVGLGFDPKLFWEFDYSKCPSNTRDAHIGRNNNGTFAFIPPPIRRAEGDES
jgi:hypothetical protein